MVLVLQFNDDVANAERDDPPESRGRESGYLVGRTSPGHSLEPSALPPPCSSLVTSLRQLQLEQSWRMIGDKVTVGNADASNSASSLAELKAEGSRMNQNGSVYCSIPHIARLLTAYPIVISIVSNLDQTDLHNLALTCHAVRLNLGQFRSQALAHTLRCIHESVPQGRTSVSSRWLHLCARDLVAPCRRCGSTVCRNCTAKPAGGLRPTRRFRRLCKMCQRIPLSFFGIGAVDGDNNEVNAVGPGDAPLARGPCRCASAGVHICRSCDQGQSGADMTYTRVWSWRNRYRNLGFGLGTGVGEGNEGVKCGRGAACLAARDLIVDIDCAETLRGSGAQVLGPVSTSSPGPGGPSVSVTVSHDTVGMHAHDQDGTSSSIFVGSSMADVGGSSSHGNANITQGSSWFASPASASPMPSSSRQGQAHTAQQHDEGAAGYYRQEVEGIGGVVKKKLKKRVRVGATVTEYEDESQTGAFLDRERSGKSRSWCAWCDRVIPSLLDLESVTR